jgi:hypothetical protein
MALQLRSREEGGGTVRAGKHTNTRLGLLDVRMAAVLVELLHGLETLETKFTHTLVLAH